MAQKELLNVLPLRRFDESRGCGTAPSLIFSYVPRRPIVRGNKCVFQRERKIRKNKVHLSNEFTIFSFQCFKSMTSIFNEVGVVSDLRFETIFT